MKIGIIGNLSAGKTLIAVYLAMQQNKAIISNCRLNIDYEYLPDESFIRWYKTVLDQKDTLRGMYIKRKYGNKCWLLDEAHNLLNARLAGSDINELITQMLRFLGKINCDIIYTSQLFKSDIDKRLREITDIIIEPMRISEFGKPLIFEERKLKRKVYIMARITYNMGHMGYRIANVVMDLERYYQYYDTEHIYVINRKAVKR